MLTRRNFTGVAGCALCGLSELVAAGASAQGTPAATTPGVTRKILFEMDGPVPGYVTISAEAEIDAGVLIARHTHPGIESGFILEGGLDLPVEGKPIRSLAAAGPDDKPGS